MFSSTCATYGEPQRIPIDEQHPQLPTNPYGWSKLFLERIMSDYDRSYGLKFVALRYFNAAGRDSRTRRTPRSGNAPDSARARRLRAVKAITSPSSATTIRRKTEHACATTYTSAILLRPTHYRARLPARRQFFYGNQSRQRARLFRPGSGGSGARSDPTRHRDRDAGAARG